MTVLADTRQVVRTTYSHHQAAMTMYRQGPMVRFETLSDGMAEPQITIQNTESGLMTSISLERREYEESRPAISGFVLSLAQYVQRPARIHHSGRTVHLYFETVDTGERKMLLGKTARHLLIHERYVAEPGACLNSYSSEKDGWYIPSAEQQFGGSLTAYATMCQDNVIRHGSAPVGLAVSETSHDAVHATYEILDLSYAPLPLDLFEVPVGFRKVGVTSWLDVLKRDYSVLDRAVESWFD